MPTNTTTYSLQKPTVGGDEDAWGGYINSNLDTIDDLLDGTTPVTGIDINSGSIDNTPIGATTASTGAFTTMSVSSTFTLGGTAVTATGAELNILDGVTATAAELNYNDITTLGTVEASKTVTADANGDVTFPDGEKASFGTGSDLQIYHDGTNSLIADTGTGHLVLRATNFQMTNSSGSQYMLVSNDGGPTYLYHNGTNRLETSASGIDVAGTVLCDGVTVDGTLDIEEVYEKVTTATSTSGTITFDTTAQGVIYMTANQSANRTINFTNVNSNLAVGQSVTCTILMTQGSTAYYLNTYQVDGTAVTPKWSGGSAPTAGNASGIDVYTFTIIKTASATFTVLASQTQFA